MIFTATEKQVKQISANATNNSSPMGLGFLHYDNAHKFIPDDFEVSTAGIYLDYVQGRMVKLNIKRKGKKTWEVSDADPRPDYQSWCHKYPSYSDLVNSAIG